MRLVINTGFFNSFFDRADTFFRATVTTASTRRVISHLENVRNRTNSLSAGGAVRLSGTLETIQARINRENARLDAIGVVVNRARDFRRLTIDTDRSVEQEMQQLHGEFFEVNHWARPIIDLGEDRQGFFSWLWGGIAHTASSAWNWVTGDSRSRRIVGNVFGIVAGLLPIAAAIAFVPVTGGLALTFVPILATIPASNIASLVMNISDLVNEFR